ncbi:14832_t:CDS:2 [Gigaspora margarita]|uniref:14832_t:CDS:1 n=1 Tax=Gigaspora margarita TaxID=4874 RepID=A0ABN7VE37_GIGMA|nr:14832_t:CDS:2 [Gigaspora margarita]
MSFVLASHSTTIHKYRRNFGSTLPLPEHGMPLPGEGLPLPGNNQPPCIPHVRLKYFKQKIPNFKVAPEPPVCPLPKEPLESKICIIGAGMAGLFSALLLQKAGFKNIQILECQNRAGGRIYTHYFEGDKEQRLYGEHGAMRLPKTEEHQMVFDTIDYLNQRITNKEDQLSRIKFIFASDNQIMTQGDVNKQELSTLGFSSKVYPKYKEIFSEAFQCFFDLLDKDFDEGLRCLMKYDEDSVYSYLRRELKVPKPYDIDETIAALEMTESATGLFRLSLVEAVMDAYTFMTDSQEWETIDYGMQRFPDAFRLVYEHEERNGLANVSIKYNHKVYKLEYKDNKVHVYWKENGESKNDIFDKVIVTCPLGVVRQWDLSEINIGLDKNDEFYHKRRAIRELNYDKSAKVFLKFKTRFWETGSRCIVGGSSTTDLPIRTVVYPSCYFDNNIPVCNPAILLASYTWANDAEKFAPYSQKENAEICAENLKILHGREVIEENLVSEEFSSIYWPNDPTTVGAFALFGPGQFSTLMYPMIKPMNNIHWAGEHTDIHHAWVVGAFNSAVRVVKEIMLCSNMKPQWDKLKTQEPLQNWHGHI